MGSQNKKHRFCVILALCFIFMFQTQSQAISPAINHYAGIGVCINFDSGFRLSDLDRRSINSFLYFKNTEINIGVIAIFVNSQVGIDNIILEKMRLLNILNYLNEMNFGNVAISTSTYELSSLNAYIRYDIAKKIYAENQCNAWVFRKISQENCKFDCYFDCKEDSCRLVY